MFYLYVYCVRLAGPGHADRGNAQVINGLLSTYVQQNPALQALLQGPCQNFKLPVADFKQAILDAQNGVAAPSSRPPSFKVRLPIGKGNLAGQAGKPKGRPSASGTKPPGRSRYTIPHTILFTMSRVTSKFGMFAFAPAGWFAACLQSKDLSCRVCMQIPLLAQHIWGGIT